MTKRSLRVLALLLALLSVLALIVAGGGGVVAATPPARLGTAGKFAILAGSTITNTGVSTVQGDVGLHPGTAVVGFDGCGVVPTKCVNLTGSLQINNAVAATAKADLLLAFNALMGLKPTCTTIATELGGASLTAGVYCSASGTFEIAAGQALTLVGDGEFIFLTETTLVTGAGSQVVLSGQAQACNAYFVVGSSATLGTDTRFIGNILSAQSITLNTRATIAGRALAMGAAATLDTNTITAADCATVPAPTTTTVPGATTTTVPGATTTTVPGATTTTVPGATTTTLPGATTTTVPRTTTTTAGGTGGSGGAEGGGAGTSTGSGGGGSGRDLTTRDLARTGLRSANWILAGLAMVLLGAGMLLASRRRAGLRATPAVLGATSMVGATTVPGATTMFDATTVPQARTIPGATTVPQATTVLGATTVPEAPATTVGPATGGSGGAEGAGTATGSGGEGSTAFTARDPGHTGLRSWIPAGLALLLFGGGMLVAFRRRRRT